MTENFGRSINKSCQLCNISRSSNGYKSKRQDDQPIVKRLMELAQKKQRYGCRRLHELLRREGLVVNHKENRTIVSKSRSFSQNKEAPEVVRYDAAITSNAIQTKPVMGHGLRIRFASKLQKIPLP